MKRVILALTAPALIATGTLFAGGDSVIAAYSLTGQWTFTFDNLPGPCPGSLSQTYGDAHTDDITITWQCPGDANLHTLDGTIDKTTGSFVFGDYMMDLFQITGTATDNHTISGHWTGFPSSFNGAFSGTGGNGDPKPGSPTPTTTATPTPTLGPPVGGVAFGSAANGDGAWWLIAIAGTTAFVTLGSAALLARKRV